jgi:hypothetical protein
LITAPFEPVYLGDVAYLEYFPHRLGEHPYAGYIGYKMRYKQSEDQLVACYKIWGSLASTDYNIYIVLMPEGIFGTHFSGHYAAQVGKGTQWALTRFDTMMC